MTDTAQQPCRFTDQAVRAIARQCRQAARYNPPKVIDFTLEDFYAIRMQYEAIYGQYVLQKHKQGLQLCVGMPESPIHSTIFKCSKKVANQVFEGVKHLNGLNGVLNHD